MPSYSNRHFVTSGAGLRDPQHAARAFVDGDFALAPRLKFQHHVVFSTLGGSNGDLSVLCKTADTPKFQVTTETANQYNKKNVIMTGITYQPITFKFYDDNSGVARKLWESYYSYTFGDQGAAKAGLYGKSLGPNYTSYGLENQPIIPFLNYIKVHTFAKRTWQGYTLINPVITAWSSDNFDWSSSAPAEHTVTVAYDAVTFDSGNAGAGSPPNFGGAHYDQTPSPLQTPGGGSSPSAGVPNGQRNGAEQIFSKEIKKADPSSTYKSPLTTALNNAASINQYTNLKTLPLVGSGKDGTINATASRTPASGIGKANINNISFPVADVENQTTKASQVKLVNTTSGTNPTFNTR